MSLKKHEMLVKEFVYDFAKDAGAVGALSLKAVDPNGDLLEEGLIVTDVMLVTETALTSAGTPTVTIGNTTDADGYMVDVWALANVVNSVVRVGQVDGALLWDSTADAKKGFRVSSAAADQNLLMTIGTAAITAGKMRVMVFGVKPGSLPHP